MVLVPLPCPLNTRAHACTLAQPCVLICQVSMTVLHLHPLLHHSNFSFCPLVVITVSNYPGNLLAWECQVLPWRITFSFPLQDKACLWALWVSFSCSNICHLLIKQLFIKRCLSARVCAVCCGRENGELSMNSRQLYWWKRRQAVLSVVGPRGGWCCAWRSSF